MLQCRSFCSQLRRRYRSERVPLCPPGEARAVPALTTLEKLCQGTLGFFRNPEHGGITTPHFSRTASGKPRCCPATRASIVVFILARLETVQAPHAQVTGLGKQQQAGGGTRTPRKSPILTKKNLQREELLRRMKITPDNTSQEGKGKVDNIPEDLSRHRTKGKSWRCQPEKNKYRLQPQSHSPTCDLHPKRWQLCSWSILLGLFILCSNDGVSPVSQRTPVTVPVPASLTSDPLCANLLFGETFISLWQYYNWFNYEFSPQQEHNHQHCCRYILLISTSILTNI